MTATTTTYPLTVTPDYVGDWGFWEGVRELLQNAIDQQTANPGSPMHWAIAGDYMVVGNPNCRLDPQALLLGLSGKRGDDRMVGRHGEGFKLAVLALLRMDCTVYIENGSEVWTPAIREHADFGAETLHFDVTPGDETDGVWFHVQGDAVLNNADHVRDCYVEADHNAVLPGMGGRVYVAGLYVDQVADFEHNYNFSPDRLRLDRDRRTIAAFDLAWETSQLWAAHEDSDEKWRLLEAGAKDVEYLEQRSDRSFQDSMVATFRSRYPGAVPVKNQEQIERATAAGVKWKLVPAALYNLVRSAAGFFIPAAGTPKQRLERFLKKYGPVLPEEARLELEDVIKNMGEK